MGQLIDGEWQAGTIQADKDGRWRRSASLLRNWVTTDGSPGPSGKGGFKAERDRYHLYVAWNCPWAHRTLLFHCLKQLEGIISLSYAAPRRTDQGWVFEPAGEFVDHLFGAAALYEIYTRSQPDYTGRVTVPVLWDKATHTIVSNESADIIRMLNTAFVDIAPETPNYYPVDRAATIDAWNQRIYDTVNNGVYKAGFSSAQAVYTEAAIAVFETLDAIEHQLSQTRYLIGDTLTEADWRLFPTLARFDVAYYSAFKCNRNRIIDYPNLWAYARELYQFPGISETVRFDVYRQGYHSPSPQRNPHGIVPLGPEIDWSIPHHR
ncbi:MAG: glutathione S-transferase family protein [Merismopedia sp. SIO2A8]|nr:glutathione S-transferase family protein [Merismopedia sp. SIO2A8]